MKENIGRADKVTRIILAMLIAAAGIYFKNWWGLLAVVPLMTALFSFCPLYKLIGVNTCAHKPVQ